MFDMFQKKINVSKTIKKQNIPYPLFTLLLISRPYFLKTHYVS
jgi:hypothetical protein